jgi:hypothetical protein
VICHKQSLKAGMTSDDTNEQDDDDDRPPICSACGVTMGIVVDDDGTPRFVCLECGFPDRLTE